MITPARSPFVSHVFVPDSRYESPARSARVRSEATSDPASGSVIEYAPRTSPEAIRGRSRDRCSSVPNSAIIQAAIVCVLITPESDIQPRASSVWTSA